MTPPPAAADGFSRQLRGNPPAHAPKAVARLLSDRLPMHDPRRSDVVIGIIRELGLPDRVSTATSQFCDSAP